jgi:hypothetical protein
MARAILLANDGRDRLVIRTICTHLVFFHEAGYEFRTECKRGRRWLPSDDAEQPRDLDCRFNDAIDAVAFGAAPQVGVGFFKLTCEVLSIRRHCVWVVEGSPQSDRQAMQVAGGDPRGVRDVELSFSYAGQRQVLRHSGRVYVRPTETVRSTKFEGR